MMQTSYQSIYEYGSGISVANSQQIYRMVTMLCVRYIFAQNSNL